MLKTTKLEQDQLAVSLGERVKVTNKKMNIEKLSPNKYRMTIVIDFTSKKEHDANANTDNAITDTDGSLAVLNNGNSNVFDAKLKFFNEEGLFLDFKLGITNGAIGKKDHGN